MAKEYVKLWLSYEDYFQPLSAAEVGRLVQGMLKYKSQGEEPVFSGNERFVWPAIKRDINESIRLEAEISKSRSEAGKLGGRPKEDESKKSKSFFEKAKKTMDKGQGQGQRTKDIVDDMRACARDDCDDVGFEESRNQEILDFCRSVVGHMTPGQEQSILEASEGMDTDTVTDAIAIAYENNASTPEYIIATIKSQKEHPERRLRGM